MDKKPTRDDLELAHVADAETITRLNGELQACQNAFVNLHGRMDGLKVETLAMKRKIEEQAKVIESMKTGLSRPMAVINELANFMQKMQGLDAKTGGNNKALKQAS